MPESVTPTPERARALEQVAERLERRDSTSVAPSRVELPATTPQSAVVPVPGARPAATVKSPLREDIEEVLAEGLEQIYAELSPPVQAQFRERGERLASRLETMIASGKVVLREVHRSIVEWLKLIPRRTKSFAYFLIQETKVKTDAILALARRTRGQ